jgi:hypothetical protein
MAFTFRGQNLDALLVEPTRAADSLYAHFIRTNRGIHEELVEHWNKFRGDKAANQHGSVKGALVHGRFREAHPERLCGVRGAAQRVR